MRGTRVLLEVIVTAFLAGATAEEIVQKFPTLSLADTYQVLAYYLTHTGEVDVYMSQSRAEGLALQKQVEQMIPDKTGLRARIIARRAAQRPSGNP